MRIVTESLMSIFFPCPYFHVRVAPTNFRYANAILLLLELSLCMIANFFESFKSQITNNRGVLAVLTKQLVTLMT